LKEGKPVCRNLVERGGVYEAQRNNDLGLLGPERDVKWDEE